MVEVVQADKGYAVDRIVNAFIATRTPAPPGTPDWGRVRRSLECELFARAVPAILEEVFAHLTPNTDLSDERAREVLVSVVRADGDVRMADNIERGVHPIIITSSQALRAMHQYAAGLQGVLTEIAKMGPETAAIWAAEKARTALGDTQS